jgi:LemA protein
VVADSEVGSAAVSAAARLAAGEALAEEVAVPVGDTCPSCREVIRRDAVFCPSCGAKLSIKRGASMSFGKVLLVFFVVVIVGLVLVGGCFYSGYNRAVAMDEDVSAAWAQVENQLQRRFDLIDNLVETVKGVAQQEKDVFLGIAESRKSYFQAKSTSEKVRAANGFESALSRLLVFRETYPELKSNQSFLKLQDSVEGTENRLSVERKRYNDKVKELNTFSRKLLGRIYCAMAGVEKAEYFEVADEAKAVPKVDFTGKTDGG